MAKHRWDPCAAGDGGRATDAKGGAARGMLVRALVACVVAGGLPLACAADARDDGGAVVGPPSVPAFDAGVPSSSDGAAQEDGGAPVDLPATVPCATTFRFAPNGRAVHTVAVTGEWNGFAPEGVPMALRPDGTYAADVTLPPGIVAYKLVIDGASELDAAAGRRRYVDGVENSALVVPDCHVPALSLASKAITRGAGGDGRFHARVRYQDSHDARGIAAGTVRVTLRKDGMTQAVPNAQVDAANGFIDVDVASLADGKYTVLVEASDRAGKAAKPLRLVFWVEATPFDWNGALLYMVMTDRFQNGDPSNDAKATAGVDPRADFQGGDLEGVRARIADGTFDQLGVRALWLSPFHTNPAGPYVADDGTHQVTGYHGYWPTKARAVDARIGGEAALRALVAEAHAHGIRVVQDFVVNHVHKDHEYVKAHPDWFRTGCVCGTANCDWTTHRLDCLFADYLPDVNWTVPAVSDAYEADAVWWLDSFDLDGLRIDAVKHVEDAAVRNLAAAIRGEFEAAGTRVFLTGETAMGWNDCSIACNAEQYDTISRYIGPFGLDGQFDFVLYHGVAYRTFAYDQKGMIHADYWTQASQWQYPAGAIMTPYIGSQDTSRFTTLASYRGQDASHDPAIANNKWANVAQAPADGDAYARHRLALAWLLTLPGAPLLYYGDEYGDWGGADPNNRKTWHGAGPLSPEEQATLNRTRRLGQARRELPALQRGAYRSVYSSEDTLVFARVAGTGQNAGETALVALTRAAAGATVTTTLPVTLPLPPGTLLHDRLGGPDVAVSGNAVTLTLGPRGAAVLAP